MRRNFKRALSLPALVTAGLMFVTTGCGLTGFSEVLPSEGQVKINLKGNNDGSQSLVGDESERAGLYEMTFGVTRGFNGITVGLLELTRTIVNTPATESPDEDHATWGPSDPKGLERLQYKATAERVGVDEYDFVLMARPKGSDSEDDYGKIYSLHYFHVGPDLGHGTITIDRDEHARVDPQDPDLCDTGSATVAFANDGDDGLKVIDIDFSQLDRSACEGDDGQMGKYHYSEAADGSGDFSFTAVGNIHEGAEAATKPLEESMTIRAQWTAEGAGRADVIVSGGEVPADLAACQDASCTGLTEVTATQCWDASFVSRYENTVPEVLQGEILPGLDDQGNANPVGDVTSCPFDFADPAASNS